MEMIVQQYLQILTDENQKQNLVSRQITRADLEQHVKDSLQVLEWYSLAGQTVIDIGSGAGFPGLVLAMAEPGCQMTLVESDLKKCVFLQTAIALLDLPNVQVIRQRVETLGRTISHRDGYDVCTSRAVASMRILLEYGVPLIKIGGLLMLWKGSRYQTEIDEAKTAMQLLGGKLDAVHTYSLVHPEDRALVVVRKASPTPPQYPRKIGIPAKRPL
jgi:16S rRNA (guanine527-N7)-methyltransferase